MVIEGGNSQSSHLTSRKGTPITCDQVAWMVAAIERYLPADRYPAISRQRIMKIYGLLYEIMESANLVFADGAALSNGTPHDVRLLPQPPDKVN